MVMCSKWRGDEWRAWGGTRGSGRRCQQHQVDTVDTETEAAGVEILRTVDCDVIRLYTAAAAALCHHAADLVQTLSQDYQSYCKVVSNVSHAIISHQK